jgi:hypothetical protein
MYIIQGATDVMHVFQRKTSIVVDRDENNEDKAKSVTIADWHENFKDVEGNMISLTITYENEYVKV